MGVFFFIKTRKMQIKYSKDEKYTLYEYKYNGSIVLLRLNIK